MANGAENPRWWRRRKELLNPAPGWRELAKFNPQLPLAAAGLDPELQEIIHENKVESEKIAAQELEAGNIDRIKKG